MWNNMPTLWHQLLCSPRYFLQLKHLSQQGKKVAQGAPRMRSRMLPPWPPMEQLSLQQALWRWLSVLRLVWGQASQLPCCCLLVQR